jgi:pseudaminic acid biosynthesis-associated methylase
LRTLLSKKDEKHLETDNFIDESYVVVEPMEDDNKKQSALWTNRFGDDYIRRNTITDTDLNIRIGMWQGILSSYGFVGGDHLKSAIEIGCGQGINLMALRKIHDNLHKNISLTGIETNHNACQIAMDNDNKATVYNIDWLDCNMNFKADLVFTSGVLIHVHKDNLHKFMEKIYKTSRKYIVCIEYFSADRREIQYHGENNALWTDDYGSLWLDKFPLHCVTWGFMWKRMTGLDNLTYWVFEKPQ